MELPLIVERYEWIGGGGGAAAGSGDTDMKFIATAPPKLLPLLASRVWPSCVPYGRGEYHSEYS